MWCPHCQSENEVASTGGAVDLRCQNCGETIAGSTRSDDSVREARDILARWSADSLLDEISSLPEIPPIPGSSRPAEIETEKSSSGIGHQISTADNSAETSKSDNAKSSGEADSRDPNSEVVAIDGNEVVSGDSKQKQQQNKEQNSQSPLRIAPSAADETSDSADVNSNSADEDFVSPSGNRPDIPGPQKPRRSKQDRPKQGRKKQSRKNLTDQAREGSKPVNRKYRVDSPGGESKEISAASSETTASPGIRGNSSADGRRIRIDNGENLNDTVATGDGRGRTHGRHRKRYIDDGHESAMRGPHFEIDIPKRSNLTAITGQFLAYLGVLGLTVGTCIVIYGHFSGAADITPTGWLVTTVAQMMLFLGVINLVSGGMEKTSDDVSARINYLGEQLMRIEQVTEEALRGPKISPRRYADPNAPPEEPARETVSVGERDKAE